MKPIMFLCFVASLILAQPSFAQKKEKKEKQATTATKAAKPEKGMKKDGTPDMRYKKNRDAAETKTAPVTKSTTVTTTARPSKTTTRTQTTTSVPVNNAPVTRTIPAQGQNRSADRVVGTDAKGRTIYEGPKGGRYYINANGNKEYVKQ